MTPKLREFLLYFGASALALALDTLVFTGAVRLGAGVPVSACLGFSLGLMLIYTLSTTCIFNQHRLHDRRSEFAAFALIGAAGLLLTEGLLWLFVTHWQLPPLPGKLCAAGFVFLFNFALRKAMLFSSRRTSLSLSR